MRKLGDMMVLVAKANGIRLSSDEVTDAEETKI
jgi:putative iron-regulated protein